MSAPQNGSFGLLLDEQNIKLHRDYFKELVRLIGVYVIYRAPRADKHWTTHQEIDGNYQEPILVGCIFHEHPDQRSMKKMGWVSELQTNESLISLSYDVPDLQVGALIIIPSGIDSTQGRLFRITSLSNTMIYPSAITCACVPEYNDTMPNGTTPEAQPGSLVLLAEEEDNM